MNVDKTKASVFLRQQSRRRLGLEIKTQMSLLPSSEAEKSKTKLKELKRSQEGSTTRGIWKGEQWERREKKNPIKSY